MVILGGPHSLIQTIYGDELLALEAVVIDEATGKIAVCTSEEVHIYKPYGKKEGVLKVGSEKGDPRPLCMVLTGATVVSSVFSTGSQLRRWHIDTFVGVGRRAFNRFLFFEALSDGGR